MNIYDKWFATEWIFSIIGFVIGIILWLGCEDENENSKLSKITDILLGQFLFLFVFTIGYFILVEVLLDMVWGLNIHLPFSMFNQ